MQRQNDPLLLTVQIALPLLILMALNPQVQMSNRTGQPAAMQVQSSRDMALLEPWHMLVWDAVLQDDAHASNWQQVIVDAGQAGRWQVLSDSGKMLLGDAYNQAGQKPEAIRAWQSAGVGAGIQRFEKIYQAQRELDDLGGALATLNVWLTIEPQKASLYYQRALLQSVLAPQEASASLDRALFMDASYQKQGNLLKQALLTKGADQPDVYYQMVVGRVLANLGEWQLAHELLLRATIAKPDYAEAWAFLGESNDQLGLDAYPAFNKALALDSRSSAAQSLMGLYWIRQGRPEKAFIIFTQLARQEPQQAVWEIQSGDALARMGQPAYAMVHYQNAVKLEPGDAQNWRQLVLFCLQNNLEVRRIGLPAARRLVLLTPDDPTVYDLHGRVLMALGDRDNAMQAFWRGLKINSASSQLMLDMGILEMDQQKSDEAFYYLSMALAAAKQQNESAVVVKAQSLLNHLR